MEDNLNNVTAQIPSSFDIGSISDQKYLVYIIGALALAGLYTVGYRIFSLIRLLLSLFILPGKPVSHTPDVFMLCLC